MASDGQIAVITAVRQFLIAGDAGIATGIYWLQPPREAPNPLTLLSVVGRPPMHLLRGQIGVWRVLVKHMATDAGDRSDTGLIQPLLDAAFTLLTGDGAQTGLNIYAVPLGFNVMKVLWDGALPFYTDTVGGDVDVERGHIGNYYVLHLQAL